MATEWSTAELLNPAAANSAMLWSAYVSLDWSKAARTGASLLRRFPYDATVANNVAFLSILAGKVALAEKALDGIEAKSYEKGYVILATRGLVDIAKGELQEGLRSYRRAAELAEKDIDGSVDERRLFWRRG